MKKIFLISIAISFQTILNSAKAQQNNNSGVQLANHIADKLKDTLGLNTSQRTQIFSANMYLHNMKAMHRRQTNDPDSLQVKLQAEENKRDSLYMIVLPIAKYQLYLDKKRNLITSN